MTKPALFFLLFFVTSFRLQAQAVNDLFVTDNDPQITQRTAAGEYGSLKIKAGKLTELYRSSPSTLQLQVPFENNLLKLDLKKTTITADNFSVVTIMPDGSRRPVKYAGGVFYQGNIEGKIN